ncbi:unnamed protein product, partial [Phyllotreta striolata]
TLESGTINCNVTSITSDQSTSPIQPNASCIDQPPIPHRKMHRKPSTSDAPFYLLVIFAAVSCYLNGLKGAFVHDDIPALAVNRDVLAVNRLTAVFSNDFWGTPMSDADSHKSYRPLTTLTFRWNYQLSGLKPIWFHSTNVLLHASASVLFTKLCVNVANLERSFSTIAGLIFAIHPVHTEAVTGIVGRADVLASVFFLLSILVYHGNLGGKYFPLASIILSGFGMLAKETGITVIVLNLLLDFYFNWPHIRRSTCNRETILFVRRAIKLLTSFCILLTVRLAILQGSLPKFSQQDNPAAFHPSVCVRFLTYCYLVAFNFWLLLCPWTLSHDWQMGSIPLVTSIGDPRNLLTAFLFGILLMLLVKIASDVENTAHTPIVLGLLVLTVPFLPATNLLVTVGFVVAERVLYIPSMGCIMLVVYGLQLLWSKRGKNRRILFLLLLVVLASQSLRTVMRNRDWKSRETLLRSGLRTLPHNAKMHYNYANYLRDYSRLDSAIEHYAKALELWPSYASAHNNIGTLLNNKTLAEQHFLAAVNYSPGHVNAHYNLGQLYRKIGRMEESKNMLKKCILLQPGFTPAYVEMSLLLGFDHDALYNLLKRAVDLNTNDPFYGTQLGRFLTRKSDTVMALVYYWKALRVSPGHREAMLGAANALRKSGQKSRLLQLITRWQLIKKGCCKPLSKIHIYIQEWHLRNELKLRAKEYDQNVLDAGGFEKTQSWINRTEEKPVVANPSVSLQHLLDVS